MTTPDDAHPTGDDGEPGGGGRQIEARSPESAPLLYNDLAAPDPTDPDPPPAARWLAFVSIVTAGLLGGLIGYGTADLMTGSSLWAAAGAVVGAGFCAIGVGIVAGLTLRAMSEWRSVEHPESETRRASGLTRRTRSGSGGDDPVSGPAPARTPDGDA